MGRGVRPRNLGVPCAESAYLLEGDTALIAMGEGQRGQGGVLDHGTYEGDDRVTWEALTPPRRSPAERSAGDQTPSAMRPRAHASRARTSGQNSVRIEVGLSKGNRSEGRGA